MAVSALQRRNIPFIAAVLIPIGAWYILFMYYPMGYSLFASLHLWVAENPSKSTFIGFKNYLDLLTTDPRFRRAIVNSFIYVATKTAIVIPLGISLATALDYIKRGQKYHIFSLFLPALCSATAIGILFTYLYQPSFGLFNQFLKTIGFKTQPFLSSAKQAIFCVIFTDSWQFMGFTTLIFYTGLMNMPDVFIEAAKIDGAGSIRTFFSVKLPLLGHTVLFLIVYTIINAFQSFDFVFVMTSSGGGTGGASGGPGNSSYVMSLLVYNEGMLRLHIDKATTVASVMFIIVLVLTIFQIKILKPKWEY
ncbi:MAG: sugar ABC transporter permease [Spirochaetales bacterium]|nr:MAG: sugar ABC transporter permease [Spirochaetales bacterium]